MMIISHLLLLNRARLTIYPKGEILTRSLCLALSDHIQLFGFYSQGKDRLRFLVGAFKTYSDR